MIAGFWKKLKRPIMALAPMANVTDAAFRRVIAKYGKPDVMFTEFTSADGLCSVGRDRLLPDFWYTEAERPIVMQIFGATPENFYRCALLAQELKFDGIDINMGCPDRNVEKQCAGAALMKNPELAKKIIRETQRGAGALPVSVKTRLGWNKDELDQWLPHLFQTELAAITIHARTRKEMSLVPARWDRVAHAVKIRNACGAETLILGNGDASGLADAEEKIRATGADGIMLGRAVFGNPWLFNRNRNAPPSVPERLTVMLEHTKLFWQLFQDQKSFSVMKKHFKAYVSDFPGCHELRVKLMETSTPDEVEAIITSFLPSL